MRNLERTILGEGDGKECGQVGYRNVICMKIRENYT